MPVIRLFCDLSKNRFFYKRMIKRNGLKININALQKDSLQNVEVDLQKLTGIHSCCIKNIGSFGVNFICRIWNICCRNWWIFYCFFKEILNVKVQLYEKCESTKVQNEIPHSCWRCQQWWMHFCHISVLFSFEIFMIDASISFTWL